MRHKFLGGGIITKIVRPFLKCKYFLIILALLIFPLGFVSAYPKLCGIYIYTPKHIDELKALGVELKYELFLVDKTGSIKLGNGLELTFDIEKDDCPLFLTEKENVPDGFNLEGSVNLSTYLEKKSYSILTPYYEENDFWEKLISGEEYAVNADGVWELYEPYSYDIPDPIAGNWNNDKYKDIDKCTDIDVKYIKACGCIPAEVADIVSKIYFILRIIGPVLLLIIGGFEMAKAIFAQDESAIEKAKKKLINKFIAAAAIFLVLTVIKFIVGIVGTNSDSIMECVEILLNGYVI